METVDKIKVLLKYNSHNVTHDFSKYIVNITYSDYEKDQSDELIVTLKDNDKLFQNSWHPDKGSKFTCIIGFENSNASLNCGTFTIDEVSFDFSSTGDTVEIKALAATSNSPLRTANTTYYKKKTLVQIAKTIAAKYGYKVAGTQGNVYVERVNQVNETDLNFLRRLASDYGYIFKLTDNILTFTKIESLTDSKSLFTLTRKDIESFSVQNAGTKKYKACSVQYFNPKTKKLTSYTEKRGSGSDTLKIHKKCTSKEQAMKIAKANLALGSKEITGNISINRPNCKMVAGVNFELKDFGIYDGRYHIKSSTHEISSDGWKITGEVERC